MASQTKLALIRYMKNPEMKKRILRDMLGEDHDGVIAAVMEWSDKEAAEVLDLITEFDAEKTSVASDAAEQVGSATQPIVVAHTHDASTSAIADANSDTSDAGKGDTFITHIDAVNITIGDVSVSNASGAQEEPEGGNVDIGCPQLSLQATIPVVPQRNSDYGDEWKSKNPMRQDTAPISPSATTRPTATAIEHLERAPLVRTMEQLNDLRRSDGMLGCFITGQAVKDDKAVLVDGRLITSSEAARKWGVEYRFTFLPLSVAERVLQDCARISDPHDGLTDLDAVWKHDAKDDVGRIARRYLRKLLEIRLKNDNRRRAYNDARVMAIMEGVRNEFPTRTSRLQRIDFIKGRHADIRFELDTLYNAVMDADEKNAKKDDLVREREELGLEFRAIQYLQENENAGVSEPSRAKSRTPAPLSAEEQNERARARKEERARRQEEARGRREDPHFGATRKLEPKKVQKSKQKDRKRGRG